MCCFVLYYVCFSSSYCYSFYLASILFIYSNLCVMKEFILFVIDEYGQVIISGVCGIVVRYIEKRGLKNYYRKRIEELVKDVRSAKYGDRKL